MSIFCCCRVQRRALDVSIHLYHSSSNVLYLGICKAAVLGPFQFSARLRPLRDMRVTVATLMPNMENVNVHILHRANGLITYNSPSDNAPGLPDGPVAVVVVSNEEPQMSPCISITAVAISSILEAILVIPYCSVGVSNLSKDALFFKDSETKSSPAKKTGYPYVIKLEDEDLNDEVENCIDKCIRLKCELDLRHNGQETSEKKDLFYSAIGSNSQIPEIEKLQYLKGQLRGEALRLVNAFPITADNYVEVWQTLLTRYDNPKDLIFTQIDNALRLPKLADDNHKSMFKLLDSCNEIVRTVKVLGYQIDSLSDVFFVEIIQDKLDKTTRKQWELQNNPRVVPSIKDLMEFLEIRAKSLHNLPNKDANVEKHSIRRESHKEMEESSIKRETAPRMEVQQKQWGHPGRSPMDYSSKRRPCRICLNRGHAGRFHPENRNFNSVEFDEKLSPYEKSDLIKLIKENKEAFAAHKMDIGHIKADPIRIKLTSQTPISLKPFRPSFSDNIEIKRQIEELLKYNVIRPSYSSYASPAMLVNKRNEGKIRLVIDYRKLNDIIKRDSEPIPRIDSILDKLSEANIFTTLDLLSGYHHLDIHPDDKEYTAFTTTHGLYEFNKLSFGLKNSPSQFQRVLRQILNKYDVDFCMNYFDDFIIFSNNFQEHLTHLKVILDICIKENIKLKLSKCKFATYQISFLGYEISNHQFSPSTNNIETIRKLNSPRNKKDLQRVLGSINIYSKFIPNYAKLRLPLNNLLKKDVKWKWDEECETAFSKLKNMITSKPILAIYNPKYPIHLYTDASQEQIGSILKQEQPDGLLKPIAYRSRRMTSYESNYCVTEQECLAIIDAVDFFLPYLDGVHFTIHTDHACLKYMKNIKNPKGRLFRWSLKLSMFDFEIKHIRGTENKEADFLSRYPIAHFVSDPELKQAQFDDNINDRKYTKFNGLLTIKKKGLIKSVVPPSLREKVLIRAHQDYGHIGVSKMLNLISPIYYWPYLIQDISNYVKHCEVCQLNKISHQKKFGLLESLPPAKDPFDLVSIDTVGGLNYYNSTKKFLHIIVDHATRYIWAFPSKSQTTDSYINCLNKIFQIQKPKQFLSDRAPSFTSPRFRKYLINNNIKQLLTSSSRPQCNGLNERLNQTIITRLRCKFNNLKGKSIPWTKLLDSVLNEYNNTPHSITGYTPTYLLYGKLPYDPPLKESEFYPPIDTARTNAYNNTLKFHQINKIRYDQHYQPSTFKVGDKVWLQTFYHPDNRKLMPPMSGPFTILKQISPVNYEIDKPQSNLGKTTMVIHSSKLRPYYSKEGFELKLTKSKIPTLEKKTNQQVAPKVTLATLMVNMEDANVPIHQRANGQHLEPKKKIIPQRCLFLKRTQRENESVSEYLRELKHLASNCSFGEMLEMMLRDRFVAGLTSESLQKRLLQEDDEVKLERVFALAVSYELAEKDAKELHEKEVARVTSHIERNRKLKYSPTKENFASATKERTCYRCGMKNSHLAPACPQKFKTCYKCKKIGHLSNVCKARGNAQKSGYVQQQNIFSLKGETEVKIALTVDGQILNGIVDTGSPVTLMPKNIFEKLWRAKPLMPTAINLKSFCNNPIKVVEERKVFVKEANMSLRLIVVDESIPEILLGREWLKFLNINYSKLLNVNKISESCIDSLIESYANLFKDELGCLKDVKLDINIKKEEAPVFCKARSLPYSLKKKVEDELECMVERGILEPIVHASWAAPIVPVVKKDGSIGICGDFRKLTDEAKRVVNINTTKGLFAYRRLPYGVAVAPNKFQRLMDNVFADIPGVACYIDDILVSGKDARDHKSKLELVFKRLEEKGLKLNKAKCKFAVDSVEYLGFRIDKDGLHPMLNKIQAVSNAPEPKNIGQLRSFIGMLMYYARFIKDTSSILSPFYQLLKKNCSWKWTNKHRVLFNKCKSLLTDDSVLAHYDPAKELVLACDASSYGLGVVLSHRYKKQESPIAFASRTLTEAKKHYSQLEKEALSIVYGCEKFRQYLLGRSFVLVTDNRPLMHLLSPHKPIPLCAASRIKRWSLKLGAFHYSVEFRKTEDHGNADALSRLPLKANEGGSYDDDHILLLRKMNEVPFSFQDVAFETKRDKTLAIVLRNVREDTWQSPKFTKENPLSPYYKVRNELSVDFGCLQWKERIVIPPKLRSQILIDLHEMHFGMVKMKIIARRYFWWPGIDKSIEDLARQCTICQESADMPPSMITEWTWPEKPWHRLHLDLACPFMGRMFLVIVDAYTKWLEIFILRDITSKTIVDCLRQVFARFGLPEFLVTDNRRQFVSREMEEFTRMNRIRHTKTSPYNPSTNGLAERDGHDDFGEFCNGKNLADVKYKALHCFRNDPDVGVTSLDSGL
ncbi:K02A2.6-like [Cordylochernes scorpioides]|uniref:RNA-directed DNA polymerase n=1 Tax=Cordylochernes scorpioides TaxID=51811 RepID=A0ABY6L626_9ARAC|nr:K02A2.6-like [Cordylochernes scorpioides]